jgi:hypothetical protein
LTQSGAWASVTGDKREREREREREAVSSKMFLHAEVTRVIGRGKRDAWIGKWNLSLSL